jgi:hypothetical protein
LKPLSNHIFERSVEYTNLNAAIIIDSTFDYAIRKQHNIVPLPQRDADRISGGPLLSGPFSARKAVVLVLLICLIPIEKQMLKRDVGI